MAEEMAKLVTERLHPLKVVRILVDADEIRHGIHEFSRNPIPVELDLVRHDELLDICSVPFRCVEFEIVCDSVILEIGNDVLEKFNVEGAFPLERVRDFFYNLLIRPAVK